MPSGMSAAITAISASNHKQYLTNNGYSALHNSDRCIPVRMFVFIYQKPIRETIHEYKNIL